MLYGQGAQKEVQELVSEKAGKSWLSPYWNQQTWGLGGDDFSMDSVLVPQILLNAIDENPQTDKKVKVAVNGSINKKVGTALKNIEEKSLFENGSEAFFITKESRKRSQIDVLEMNVGLWQAYTLFNKHNDKKNQLEWPLNKARNYFSIKARLADDVNQAYNSIKGLTITNEVPQISLTVDDASDEGRSGTIMITDWISNPVQLKEQASKELPADVELVSTTGERVSIKKHCKADKATGKINFKGVKDLSPGRYHVELMTVSGDASGYIKSCGSFEVQKPSRFISMKYSVS